MLLKEFEIAIKIFKKYNTLVLVNIIGLSIGLSSALLVSYTIDYLQLNKSFKLFSFILIIASTINYSFSNTSSVTQRATEIGIRTEHKSNINRRKFFEYLETIYTLLTMGKCAISPNKNKT